MKPGTVETLSWILIFGGLGALSLSWFIASSEQGLALSIRIASIVATAAGVLLIYVRSRMKDPDRP